MQASALLQRGCHAAVERAGIRRVRYHDLRHPWASNLLEAGVNIADVSRDLGHANVYITLKIYAHAVPKVRRGTSDQLAKLMAQSGNKMETREEAGEASRSADRAQAVDLAERQGWHSAHPCTSPLRGDLKVAQNGCPAVLSNPGTSRVLQSLPKRRNKKALPKTGGPFYFWRRDRDSNPGTPVRMLLEFQSSAFDHSAISPFAGAKITLRRAGSQVTLVQAKAIPADCMASRIGAWC